MRPGYRPEKRRCSINKTCLLAEERAFSDEAWFCYKLSLVVGQRESVPLNEAWFLAGERALVGEIWCCYKGVKAEYKNRQ